MALVTLARGSAEWREAWAGLYRADSSRPEDDRPDPRCGEQWQYMGSPSVAALVGYGMLPASAAAAMLEERRGFVHEFRHRSHPRSGERVYRKVPCSPGWRPDLEPVEGEE